MDESYLLMGVIGKPVLHSRSPEMHNAALRAAGVPGRYIRVAARDARDAVSLGRELGFRGLNVTAPFKEEAYEISEERDELSKLLHAANTLVFAERLYGFNTDVYGVAEALRANGAVCEASNAVVLGAGAAAKAVVCALREAGACITVVNRSFDKAQRLADEFEVKALSLEDPGLYDCVIKAKIIVSCVSTTERVLPQGLISPEHCILEAVYKGRTALVEEAMSVGAQVIDGVEWLLYQGARAFEHFSSRNAALEEMKKAIMGRPSWQGKRTIALMGMMGTGKSTIGEALAANLGYVFVDLDRELETFCGKSIQQYMSELGEPAFRDLETEVLASFAGKSDAVLACGGGVVLRPENRRRLHENCISVWLHARVEALTARVNDDGTRPLLNGGELGSRLAQLIDERRTLYAEVADLLVNSSDVGVDAVAERIAYEIRAAGIASGTD